MNYKPLILSLYEIGAIKFGDFTLKNGENSKIYIDLRTVISYPMILKAVSEALWQQMSGYPFDMICGVPYTALPIATCISLQQDIPMVMRRKEKKNYGTKQIIEGEYKTGQKCLVIEDVLTTGSSIIETANDLEIAGMIVRNVVVLVNRQQDGEANLRKKHYVLNAAITLSDILAVLSHSSELRETDRPIIDHMVHEGA